MDAPPRKKQSIHPFHPDFELVQNNGELRYKCRLPQCENVAAVLYVSIQGHIKSKRHQKSRVWLPSPDCDKAVSHGDSSNDLTKIRFQTSRWNIFPTVLKQLPIRRRPSRWKGWEDGDEEDEDSYQEDSITTSSYSSEERDEDWKISSLGTESDLNSSEIRDLVDHDDDVWELSSLGTLSVIAHLNSPDRGCPSDSGDSFYAHSEWQDSLDTYPLPNPLLIRTKETKYWNVAPPAPQQWWSSWDWRYCRSCQGPHPSGELKCLLCIEVGLKDMRDCDVRTAEEGRKREEGGLGVGRGRPYIIIGSGVFMKALDSNKVWSLRHPAYTNHQTTHTHQT
ncbi:hypothetical protein EV702DRAFT_1204816 [Suillus placidus]|uniref:Uncharacterized protein n=1 Tax=Suillus placidus TaxID=48579 RepID=A0A9P6ZG95_9AGAM|nr:hypothetical protein EV702DRAFT_1204816 [Suillus placidus]